MRALNAQEIATISNKSARKYDSSKRDDIDWLYNNPEAVEQIKKHKTVVTAMGKVWEVTYDGNRVVYREQGKRIPCGNVLASRFSGGGEV